MPRFMQVFPTTLNGRFSMSLENNMLGHENDQKVQFSVCDLIRHDEPCCGLYRHAARHHDSSSLSGIAGATRVKLMSLSGKFCSGLVMCKINFYFWQVRL
jgi:hypothetical protein